MISELLYNRSVIGDIQKSLDTYSMRQKVISNNIANAMTPGYQAMKVSFEDEYRATLYPPADTKSNLNTTHEKHIIPTSDHKTFKDVFPRVDYKESPMNDTGLNNVDIDKEMADMAENSLRYEMSTKLLTRRLNGVRNAIRGSA